MYTNHKVAKKAEIGPETRLIGYARVSTQDQNLDLQIKALKAAGVMDDNLRIEKVSAVAKKRPALEYAIMDCRPGDTFLVWRLDRLARSVRDLYARLDRIYGAGASFKSLTENFDFGAASGKFILSILGLVAEFERQMIAARTKAGIEAFRKRGNPTWGRTLFMTKERIERAGELLNSGKSGPEVAKIMKISTASVYAHWKQAGPGKFVRKRKKK